MHLALASMAGGLALATVAVVARHRDPPRAWGWAFVVLLFVAAVFAIAGCAEGAYVSAPPVRYQGNTRFIGETHNPEDMPAVCRGAVTIGEHGSLIVACFKNGVVHIPNPRFNPKLTGDALGHELGHVNLWPKTHPR